MSKPIRVPNIPAPVEPLCWQQPPDNPMGPRCDRRAGHGGRHTWEMAGLCGGQITREIARAIQRAGKE